MAQDLNRCYERLGLTPEAGLAEIKSAFRSLARRLHPDLHPDRPELAEEFSQVKRAYDFCQALAQVKEARRNLADPAPAPAQAAGYDYPELAVRLANVEIRGLDLTYEVVLAGDQAERGGRARLPHRHDQVCPDCHGEGQVLRLQQAPFRVINQTCPRCQGAGRVARPRHLVIDFPPNLTAGAKFRVKGRGRLDATTGRRGDLFIRVADQPA